MNEDTLIAELTSQWPTPPPNAIGAGDDCALLPAQNPGEYLVFKIDAIVEGRHFTSDAPAEKVGHKALARALSDFAAMAATPRAALVCLTLPSPDESRTPYLKALYRGMGQTAEAIGVALLGGETLCLHDSSAPLQISISAWGRAPISGVKLRSTAREGDLICVTGQLGGSLPTGHHLSFLPRLNEALALREIASSMMDLSDGLGKDLPRLARASGVGFEIQPDLLPCREGFAPENALNDGEDYELLFTVPPEQEQELAEKWDFSTPYTRIGTILSKDKGYQSGGLKLSGYDHLETH